MSLLIFLKKYKWYILSFILVAILIFLILPSQKFVSDTRIEIVDGESIRSVSKKLKSEHIIKNSTIFNLLIMLTGDGVVAGEYLFKDPTNIFVAVRRVAQGDYQIPMYKITYNEGITVEEIAKRTKYYVPNFDEKKFIELAQEKEGYLFPDTYKIKDTIKPEELIILMEDNFNRHITENEEVIKSSKYSLEQIIIMASIVEKEATADTRQEVANVLWRRFEDGMALQVDAPFVYSHDKGTFDLTKADLTDGKNKFNTYKNVGLIPSPISNPGIDSIIASAKPEPTVYYYFLTGRDGKMYFAKTFEQHKLNKAKYF